VSVHVLGELAIGELDQFLAVFAGEGQDKRWEHGCVCAEVFTPVGEDGTVLVLLEFPDRESFEGFRDDPTTPATMTKGGAREAPRFRLLERTASFDH
jgi:quinol monooxygenase YgiN